jgi:hypothetical protein
MISLTEEVGFLRDNGLRLNAAFLGQGKYHPGDKRLGMFGEPPIWRYPYVPLSRKANRWSTSFSFEV